MSKTFSFPVQKTLTCDTVVIGGGVAGCAAATAAARSGSNTLLVESTGCLGGQATLGLVTPLDARTSVSGKPFGGLLQEIVDKTEQLSRQYCSCGAQGEVWSGAAPHILKYVLLDMVSASGARLLFHTHLVAVNADAERIRSVLVSTKSGLWEIEARTFIDASGDADLVALSGAAYEKGSGRDDFRTLAEAGLNKAHYSDNEYDGYEHATGLMQPASIFFLMGNVDFDKAATLNNKDLKFGDLGITRERFEAWKFAGTCGFEITGDAIPLPQGRVLVTRSTRENVAVVNMSRVVGIDGSDADDLSRGEILAQKQVIALVDFLRTFLPGFERAYYIQSGFTLGVRETRRMVGLHTLTGAEAIHCVPFPDVVAHGSYIIDIHDPTGKSRAIGGSIQGDCYDIPYRCLLSRDYPNLMACGRCISADHIAHSSTRIQGTCILTGQACGTAAALAAQHGCDARSVPADALQAALRAAGVRL